MGEFFVGVLVTLFTFFVFLLGQLQAHDEIKVECLRQGSFYVGKYNFECSAVGAPQ